MNTAMQHYCHMSHVPSGDCLQKVLDDNKVDATKYVDNQKCSRDTQEQKKFLKYVIRIGHNDEE